MKKNRPLPSTYQLFEALHIAEMQILADYGTRIQQPVEKKANETILEAIGDAIKAAKKDGMECTCHE